MLTIFKIFSTVTKLQRCRREHLEAYNFLSGGKILCSLTASLRRVILFREYGVSGFTKNSACLRCEHGCKKEKKKKKR